MTFSADADPLDAFAPRPASPAPVKQVIVVNHALKKMRTGKWVSQGGHGPLAAFLNAGAFEGNDEDGGTFTVALSRAEWLWARHNFKKITLSAPDDATLRAIHEAALEMGLKSTPIIDSGATEFHNVPTLTLITIGPDYDDRLDALTGPEGLFGSVVKLF